MHELEEALKMAGGGGSYSISEVCGDTKIIWVRMAEGHFGDAEIDREVAIMRKSRLNSSHTIVFTDHLATSIVVISQRDLAMSVVRLDALFAELMAKAVEDFPEIDGTRQAEIFKTVMTRVIENTNRENQA